MTRLWPEGQPIQVWCGGDGAPHRFTWHGYHYHILAIQQQWQVDTDWWESSGRVWRAYLAVATREGLFCVIYQDLLDDMWYLSKAYD
ncbi:MAG: hypothetical protein KDE31_26885 [Caldilineaceae bacterium]|nr:hypothetical protein [Caldilineaceae bacterium]